MSEKTRARFSHCRKKILLRKWRRNNTTRRATHFQSCFNLTSFQINFLFLPEKNTINKKSFYQLGEWLQFKIKSSQGDFSAKHFSQFHNEKERNCWRQEIMWVWIMSWFGNVLSARKFMFAKEYKLYQRNGKEKLHNTRMDTQKSF